MLSFICLMAILLTAASLIPGATSLKLSSHGFTVRTWFRDESFRWTDVKEFRLITYRYLGFIPIRRSVGFRFSETYKRNVLRRIAGALLGPLVFVSAVAWFTRLAGAIRHQHYPILRAS